MRRKNKSANYIYSLFPVRKINNLFIIYRNLSSIEMLLLAPLTPIVYIYIRSLFESAERAKRDLYPWISLGTFPPLCYQSEWSVSIRCGQDQVYGRREREMEERKAYLYRGCCTDIAWKRARDFARHRGSALPIQRGSWREKFVSSSVKNEPVVGVARQFFNFSNPWKLSNNFLTLSN